MNCQFCNQRLPVDLFCGQCGKWQIVHVDQDYFWTKHNGAAPRDAWMASQLTLRRRIRTVHLP